MLRYGSFLEIAATCESFRVRLVIAVPFYTNGHRNAHLESCRYQLTVKMHIVGLLLAWSMEVYLYMQMGSIT